VRRHDLAEASGAKGLWKCSPFPVDGTEGIPRKRRKCHIESIVLIPRSLRKGECKEQASLIEATILAACLVIALTAETIALP